MPEPLGGLRRGPAADLPPADRRDGGAAARRRRRSGSGTTRRSTRRRAAARPTPTRTSPTGPSSRPNTITAWIPFDGSTLESGAMGYLPGSHRLGVREFVDIFTGQRRRPAGPGRAGRDRRRCSSRCRRVGRLPPRPHVPLGQAEPDRYRPPGAHRDLLRRRVHPGRGALPASLGGAGGDRHGRGDRQRRHADRLAPPRRRTAPCRPRSRSGDDRAHAPSSARRGRSGVSSASPASPRRRRARRCWPG